MTAADALLKAKSDKHLAKLIEPDILIRCSRQDPRENAARARHQYRVSSALLRVI